MRTEVPPGKPTSAREGTRLTTTGTTTGTTTTERKATYRGSCHCGRARFEVDLALDHVRSCDCSICRRRGALIHRVEEASLRILTPLGDLTLYQWGRRTAEDYFCPVCGILPFRRPGARTEAEIAAGVPEFTGWSINVRCLEGVELEGLPVTRIPGSRLD